MVGSSLGLPGVGILLWLGFPPLLPAESSNTLPQAQSRSPSWALGKGTESGPEDPGGHRACLHSSVSVCPGVLQQVTAAEPQALFPQ